ncbi:class I SAM-dependent methyltransferase [Ktedonobacter racemifer]|uniref:Methyltransferase type 11 n=1 Tax=Ktedonobacter racemifer DSM 44963 TaxID=485913 RepID=D6U697_KTERA|nr:class I SAM-dependent methyltransferase [Ktedonobacter racemifer]EFH80508.1 Methyltransferase type 11 [Ktedonobacter racemifer DSM 44963]
MPLFSLLKRKQRGTIPAFEAPPLNTTPTATIIGERRFRVDVPYLFPKDMPEYDRLTFQHYFLKTMLNNSNYAAPLEYPKRILDVGSGTGIWGREMAQTFPGAQVVGFDIEAQTPLSHVLEIPSNCLFIQGDVLKGLPFSDNDFDFTHQRLMVAALPARIWPFVVSELTRVTHPGGYVELIDAADTFENMGPATKKYMEWWHKAERRTGFDASLMTKLPELLGQAGLQDIKDYTIKVPLGAWAGRGGELLAKDLHAIFANLKSFYCSTLKLSEQEFETMLKALPREWENHHTYFHFYLAYGQKMMS